MIMYIGMDIGGTNVRIASTDSLIDPKITNKVAFRSEPSYAANIHKIKEAIDELPGVAEGIGIGTPGKLNPEKTHIIFTRYASQWVDKPLVQDLTEMIGCRVLLDGDSPVGALGEALYGSHADQDFYYITYGTGIGSARVIFKNGRPTSHKLTNEDHALYLNPWQQECGGRGIENTIGKPAASLTEAEWGLVMNKFQGHLLKYIECFRPSILVFGGGVAVKQWQRVQDAVSSLLEQHPEIDIDISLTSLGEDAGLYGAFGLLRQEN